MGQSKPDYLDAPPVSSNLTRYDREHMTLYLRIQDANRGGADWREVAQILFGLDPSTEPDKCRAIHDTHLARAKWVAEHGYKQLLEESQSDKPG